MVRLEQSRVFPVEREVGFDYITKPTNWPEFWPDLVEIPDLEQTRWQEPGDTARLQMKLAGRLTELHMTLELLTRPVLVRYHSTQQGVPDAAHERHFEPAAGGFEYRLVVSFEPRPGLAGLFDRTVVRYATSRALRRTLDALDERLPRSASRPT
jgi:polyketide cyclase/dehydrase/lipid transport protein